jgi:hypothetical protein
MKLNGMTQEFDTATSLATAEKMIEVAMDPDVSVRRLWEILRKANTEQKAAISLGMPVALIAAYSRVITVATAQLQGKPTESPSSTEAMPEVPDMRASVASVPPAPAPQAPTGAKVAAPRSRTKTSFLGPNIVLGLVLVAALAAIVSIVRYDPAQNAPDASGNVESDTSR